MATPHIAGAMALLWSAIPSLQNQIDPSRAALNNAAVHIASTQCGAAGPPNNVYGWGRVDILAAVTSAHTDSDSDGDAWTDSAQRPGEKGGGNKYITSQMEGGDLGQRRRLPRWKCDRDNAERWFV